MLKETYNRGSFCCLLVMTSFVASDREEVKRLKAAQSDLDHKEAFKIAAGNVRGDEGNGAGGSGGGRGVRWEGWGWRGGGGGLWWWWWGG